MFSAIWKSSLSRSQKLTKSKIVICTAVFGPLRFIQKSKVNVRDLGLQFLWPTRPALSRALSHFFYSSSENLLWSPMCKTWPRCENLWRFGAYPFIGTQKTRYGNGPTNLWPIVFNSTREFSSKSPKSRVSRKKFSKRITERY